MAKSLLQYTTFRTKNDKVLKYIVRYNILQDGKNVETGIKTWQEALAHARKYKSNIFNKHIVEILNLWTGEIVTIEEAERRALNHEMARHCVDHM